MSYYLHTVLNNTTLLSTRYRPILQHYCKDTISGVHVSPGSAETTVRRGGITNHHLIALAYCLGASAPKLPKWLIYVEVIACYISVVFRHNVDFFRAMAETA